MSFSELCEILMIVLFGCSWPMNVIKSYRVRTAKGKSLSFLLLVLVGYTFGIIGKIVSNNFKWYVLFFYCLNFTMVFMDFLLYFRNLALDRKAEAKKN